jgi:hypothetical protein
MWNNATFSVNAPGEEPPFSGESPLATHVYARVQRFASRWEDVLFLDSRIVCGDLPDGERELIDRFANPSRVRHGGIGGASHCFRCRNWLYF